MAAADRHGQRVGTRARRCRDHRCYIYTAGNSSNSDKSFWRGVAGRSWAATDTMRRAGDTAAASSPAGSGAHHDVALPASEIPVTIYRFQLLTVGALRPFERFTAPGTGRQPADYGHHCAASRSDGYHIPFLVVVLPHFPLAPRLTADRSCVEPTLVQSRNRTAFPRCP